MSDLGIATEATPVERVLAALDNCGCEPYESGNGWVARCPAHEDRSPSFGVAVGDDDRALIICRAGCLADDVLEALGLTMSDLFSGSTPHEQPSATRAYLYEDESGAPLFRVERLGGRTKKFLQSRPDQRGNWLSGVVGVRRVVYHLPEVVAAVATGATIYVSEGEKDVDNLRAYGLVATCNSQGAGQWKPHHAEALAGAGSVVVIADRDNAGWKHAVAVQESLKGRVGSVRIVQAAVGKDASDHLAAGYGIEDFVLVKT